MNLNLSVVESDESRERAEADLRVPDPQVVLDGAADDRGVKEIVDTEGRKLLKSWGEAPAEAKP